MMGTMTITSPNTVEGERTRDPVGTGPYRFVSWTPGTNVVLERFQDYWGEAPAVEKVTYVFRGESAVRAAMVATGEADIAPNVAVQDATDPAMDFSYFNSETSSFRIDVNKPPLDDVRVRKAMTLALDRWGGSQYLSDIAIVRTVGGIVFPNHPLAATEEELNRTCLYLHDRAMTSLRQVAAMKRVSLPDLRGQLRLPPAD
jgi:hypothetical protein